MPHELELFGRPRKPNWYAAFKIVVEGCWAWYDLVSIQNSPGEYDDGDNVADEAEHADAAAEDAVDDELEGDGEAPPEFAPTVATFAIQHHVFWHHYYTLVII